MMMQDIAMHVLDIGMNSIKAKASQVTIQLTENTLSHELSLSFIDNGVGMTAEELKQAQNPFYTSRSTRKVGLGIPFIKAAAEMCGGKFLLQSQKGEGTILNVTFDTSNIDCPPLGSIADSIVNLMVFDETINLIFEYVRNSSEFTISTFEIKQELEDVSMSEPAIRIWLTDFIKENMERLKKEEQS